MNELTIGDKWTVTYRSDLLDFMTLLDISVGDMKVSIVSVSRSG